MKKLLLLPVIALIGLTYLQAQTLFEENFEGGTIPTGWVVQSNATDGGWKVGTIGALSSQYFSITPNGSSGIAATNDDTCNCDKSDEYFITPPIDLSDVTTAVLKFDAFFTDDTYQGNAEDATIEVSLDGINWEVLEDLHGHSSWDIHAIDLSDYAGQETVYIGFRYDDGSGWLYGFAIDNVIVEVPPVLDAKLVQLTSRGYGEVNTDLPIKGVLYNEGVSALNSLEISYTVDGGNAVSETIEGLDIPAFTYYHFETVSPWQPDAPGLYSIDVTISAVNGTTDENGDNNTDSFDPEIFDLVIVPNKIEEFILAPPVIEEVTGAANYMDKPTDLDFFPILGKDELWVVNQRTENDGGSTLTISDATAATPTDFWHRVDGNAWHFMSLPTGIAFSDDNFNFATSPGVKDANHGGGTFTGPTLWSSDPEIYAQPSGGNGSHLDMLHGSPFSMGIAHEVDNVFWVYDDWNQDIVRYDFVGDHGPGNDDHSDAIVRRYKNLGIDTDGNVPNHMILDKTSGWLYFVDNGNDRVMRIDINSGTPSINLPLINEPLAEHTQVTGFTSEVIIDEGLERPCGIEILENRLLVGDYATGDIVVYDMENDFEEIGRIPTLEPGLTGIKVGPDGNIWYTNRIQNTLMTAQPGEVSSTAETFEEVEVRISPNPSTGILWVTIPNLEVGSIASFQLSNANGQAIFTIEKAGIDQQLDLSNLPNGIYFLYVKADSFYNSQKIILNR